MENKKIWYIIAAVGAALVLAGLGAYKLLYGNETLPSIENVQKVEQEEAAIKEKENAGEVEVPASVSESKSATVKQPISTKITPPKPKAKAPAINPKYIQKPSAQENSYERKFTPEEEEALKKVPTSKVVVVDKEIKLKSSRKYFFK